jgi:hypothetical protein
MRNVCVVFVFLFLLCHLQMSMHVFAYGSNLREPRASIVSARSGSTQMRSWRHHTDAWRLNVDKPFGTNMQQGPVRNDDQYRKVLPWEKSERNSSQDSDPWLQWRVRHPSRGEGVSTRSAFHTHGDVTSNDAHRAGRSHAHTAERRRQPVAMPTDEARRAALRAAGAVAAVATSSSASSAPPHVAILEELHQVTRAILHAANLSIMAQGDADDLFNLLRPLHEKVIQQLHHGEQDDIHGEHVALLSNVLRQQWCRSDPAKSSEAMQWLEQAMHTVDKKLVRRFEIMQDNAELEVQIHAMQSLQRAFDIVADHMRSGQVDATSLS